MKVKVKVKVTVKLKVKVKERLLLLTLWCNATGNREASSSVLAQCGLHVSFCCPGYTVQH